MTAQTHITLHINNCAFLQLPKHMLHTFYNKMDANMYKNIPHHLSPWHCFTLSKMLGTFSVHQEAPHI